MIDDVKYRNKYEANDMTEREELIYLKEENKKLREAIRKSKKTSQIYGGMYALEKLWELIEKT